MAQPLKTSLTTNEQTKPLESKGCFSGSVGVTFVISPDDLSPVLEAQGWEERTDPSMLSSGFHMYTMYGMCVSGEK